MLICFFTIDEILGSAGLKDMTKGVLSVFVAFMNSSGLLVGGLVLR